MQRQRETGHAECQTRLKSLHIEIMVISWMYVPLKFLANYDIYLYRDLPIQWSIQSFASNKLRAMAKQ